MKWQSKFLLALIIPSTVVIVPLPVNRFPNKLTPKMSNKIPGNPPCCYITSFLIVLLTSTRFLKWINPNKVGLFEENFFWDRRGRGGQFDTPPPSYFKEKVSNINIILYNC